MPFVLLGLDQVIELQIDEIESTGGKAGLRDRGLLESALSRADSLVQYGGADVDARHIAASLGFGVCKNHAFLDGNKRISLLVADLTLNLNGWAIIASERDVLQTWQQLAAGEVSESDFRDWILANTARVVSRRRKAYRTGTGHMPKKRRLVYGSKSRKYE